LLLDAVAGMVSAGDSVSPLKAAGESSAPAPSADAAGESSAPAPAAKATEGSPVSSPSAKATAGASAHAAAEIPASAALVLPVPLEIVDGIALVALEQAEPARIRPLDEVRDEIRDSLKREAALRLAHAAAAEARKAFTGETAPEEFRGRLAESGAFSRAMPVVPGLEGSESLALALLSSQDGAWLPGVHDTARGTVIARVAEVVPIRDEDWLRVKDAFMAQFLRHKADEAAISFLRNMLAAADIVQPEGVLEQLTYR
jgi:hypothetical protein